MPLVDNAGQAIFFEDTGSGPPVVLGHSFLCTGDMWRGQVPALARQFRVLNLDLRGHGRSGRVARPCTLYDAVSDVLAVLDHLGIEQAVWCGLSIGGMVALRAALTAPTRVSGLILLDTDAGPESAIRTLKYRAMGFGVRLAGIARFAAPIARLMFGATTRRVNPALVADWKLGLAGLDIASVLQVLAALTRRDSLLARLHGIAVPTLVLAGEEDRSLPPPLSRRIHALVPGSALVQIPAAGHLSALEQPEAVTRAILGFLEARGP